MPNAPLRSTNGNTIGWRIHATTIPDLDDGSWALDDTAIPMDNLKDNKMRKHLKLNPIFKFIRKDLSFFHPVTRYYFLAAAAEGILGFCNHRGDISETFVNNIRAFYKKISSTSIETNDYAKPPRDLAKSGQKGEETESENAVISLILEDEDAEFEFEVAAQPQQNRRQVARKRKRRSESNASVQSFSSIDSDTNLYRVMLAARRNGFDSIDAYIGRKKTAAASSSALSVLPNNKDFAIAPLDSANAGDSPHNLLSNAQAGGTVNKAVFGVYQEVAVLTSNLNQMARSGIDPGNIIEMLGTMRDAIVQYHKKEAEGR